MTRPPQVAERRAHIALLVETSLASGRDILTGISRYVRENATWSLYHEAHGLTDALPSWLKAWRGDGIIARVQNPEMAEVIRSTGAPVVDVLGVASGTAFPLVHVNNRAIGQLAAQHLRDRGLRRFGYFGLRNENWSQERFDAFRQAVSDLDPEISLWESSRDHESRLPWDERVDSIAHWVRSLPKPSGIFLGSDQAGPQLLEACRRAGVRVPDQLAVLGVDNDEPLCEVCSPSLSSIDANHQAVGYEAAALLADLLKGARPPNLPITVKPRLIVPRMSTDMLAVEDPAITAALRFIRDRGHEGIQVTDVAREVGLSRSVLQRRFRALLKRSVHQEILGAKIKRAEQLLLKSRLPLATVAIRAGFNHLEYMGAVLKARTGATPAELRNKRRR
jgi:LacI family transcriptional regulator